MGNCVQKESSEEDEPRKYIKKRGSDTLSTTTTNQINTTGNNDDDNDNKNSGFGEDICTLTHYALRYLWNNNFSAPVKDLLKSGGRCVLDIGCGSGTWILEMSYDYPSTSFVGIG
ncbi:11171_t:CDS:2, partial [Entrophospora sp. SA101]